jgi:hypothetical protein
MSLIEVHVNYHYSTEVCRMISEKYNVDPMDALRRYLNSETHRMFLDPELEMLGIPPIGIFDMWEVEQVTGDARNSLYIGRDGHV